MESDTEQKGSMMIEQDVPHNKQIDPLRARFPYCVVWTPLPVISWLLPFVGHVGICREDGVILDFAGPNFVCVDNFAFGSVSRFIQISKEKCSITYPSTTFRSEEEYMLVETGRNQNTWDDTLRKSTQEYQHRTYNIFTCNCHSFVANNLNRLEFQGGGWNVVNLAALILFKGQWVNTASMVRSSLPFVLLIFIGITFGGASFLTFLALFVFLIVGWFLCEVFDDFSVGNPHGFGSTITIGSFVMDGLLSTGLQLDHPGPMIEMILAATNHTELLPDPSIIWVNMILLHLMTHAISKHAHVPLFAAILISLFLYFLIL